MERAFYIHQLERHESALANAMQRAWFRLAFSWRGAGSTCGAIKARR